MVIIMLIILIMINILVSLFYTKKVKTIANPCLILNMLWIIILLFYNTFCIDIFGQLDGITYFVVLFGLLSFQIGVILQYCSLKRKKNILLDNNRIFNYKTLKYLTFFNIIFYFLYLHRLHSLVNSEFGEYRILERIKLIHGYRNEGFGILNNFLLYLTVFWIFLFILLILHKVKFNKYIFINFLMGIVYFILVGKRLNLIVPILSVAFAKILTYRLKMREIRKVLRIVGILFSLSMFYFFFLHKRFSNTGTSGIIAIIPYFGMPLKNLDTVIKEELYKNNFFFPNFLRLFYAILNKLLDSNIHVHDIVKDYLTYGNFTSNLYTTYFTILEDFGYKGIIIFQFLLGNIFGYIFKNRKNLACFILYCIWIEVLLLQYAQDNFFPFFSLRFQQIIFVLLLNKLLIKRIKRKNK